MYNIFVLLKIIFLIPKDDLYMIKTTEYINFNINYCIYSECITLYFNFKAL